MTTPPQPQPYAGPPVPPGPPPPPPPAPYGWQSGPHGGQPGPYGHPGPYGPPPVGPPPRRGSAGKVIGIVAAALIGAFMLFRAFAEVQGWNAPSLRAGPPPEYTLTLPDAVEGGRLPLTEDLGDTFRPAVSDPDLTVVGGRYHAASGGDRLVFMGYHGEIGSPERSRNGLLDGMEDNPSSELAVPRREITPAGSDEPLVCEVLVKAESGTRTTVPVCAWGDRGTVGSVMDNSVDTAGTDPGDVDLDAFAERVGAIRDEVREPIG